MQVAHCLRAGVSSILCGLCNYCSRAGALSTVESASDLVRVIGGWLDDPDARRTAGEAAAATLGANRGATHQVASLLRDRARDVLGR